MYNGIISKGKQVQKMKNAKKMSMLLAAAFLLAACGGNLDQGSEPAVESQSEAVSESLEETVSSETEMSSEETTSESSSEAESGTQMNEDEAALIERALTTIADLTGYSEEDYFYMIHPVEGNVVTVEVRENMEETASMIGMFKYNDETKAVQEMDMVTGEFVDYPAE